MTTGQVRKTLALLLLVGAAAAGSASDLVFQIRYFDKRVYSPESDILVRISLTNKSPDAYRFRIAEKRAFSLRFDVRNLTNQPLRESRKFIIDRNSNQPTLFREVLLESGEEYALTLNLKDFVAIENPGMYTVTARFFPDLNRGPASRWYDSNSLVLSVRPTTAGLAAAQDAVDLETGELLRAEALAPDEVVAYTIEARRKGQWNKFFLYLDLERLYQRVGARADSFRAMSQSEQRAALENYRRRLMSAMIDEEILTIPSTFEIVRTTYTQTEGTVEVIQKFQYQGYREVKKYTYYLYRADEYWKIYNYEIQNLGTE